MPKTITTIALESALVPTIDDLAALDAEHDAAENDLREDIAALRDGLESLREAIRGSGITPPPPTPVPEPVPAPIPLPPADPVDNPRSDDHAAFTRLIALPNLVHAESFRPTDTETAGHYYGRLQHGGSPGEKIHPRLVYDETIDAAKNLFVAGEKGQIGSYQTRVRWPAIHPGNAQTCTVRCEYLIPHSGWRGGKQWQIATSRGSLHIELKCGATDLSVPDWVARPNVRVYGAEYIGGRGLNDLLVGGSGDKAREDYCSGINKCPLQPALSSWKRLGDIATTEEHLAGELWGFRPMVWATVEFTQDWRDPDNHKFWLHCSDADTGRVLIVGTNGDGYPLRFTPDKTPMQEFWLEYNNSSTANASDSHIWVRNLAVLINLDPATGEPL